MSVPTATVIPEILEEHFEETAFLWGQRETAIRSPAWTNRTLVDLEGRIDAHVEGLLLGSEQTIELVKDGLVAEEAPISFASAFALLRLKLPDAAWVVIEVFRQAQEGQLEGMRQALCHGPVELILEELRRTATTAAPAIAVAAIEALAFHSQLGPEAKRLEQFLCDGSPEVRRATWRINAQLGFVRNQQQFEVAFADKDRHVRKEALWSAGWTRQAGLLSYCRGLAATPSAENWDALLLLAILGKPDDLQRVQNIGRHAELGPRRLQILGAYGHPGVVEELLRAMENPDLRSAVAAGAAFTKITGCDVESDKRVQLPPEDGHEPDEFEKEFLDEAKLPDVQKARAHWQKVRDQFTKGTRWCRSFDLSQGAKLEILDQLDMESRWEACLRGKFEGTWQGGPFDLERFPQPKPPARTS